MEHSSYAYLLQLNMESELNLPESEDESKKSSINGLPNELSSISDFESATVSAGQSFSGNSESLRMTKELLTQHFTLNRERLWRTVQVRMDQRLYGRVDPDDVLQEAYLDAMKRVGHFAEEVSYTPFVWLRLIVGQTLINVHRRHIKAKMRDASKEKSIDGGLKFQLSATSQSLAFQLAMSQTSPSQAAIRVEEVEKLSSAIDELSDIDREVLTLRHFEELSNKEVAEMLEIDVKAASIRYVRAIQRLKKCLGNQQFEFPG